TVACSSPSRTPPEAGLEASAQDARPPSGPHLAELRVSASASGPSLLAPQFAPGIHDYYVRCTAGANALTVSMTAGPGAMSSLKAPAPSRSSADLTLRVSLMPNEAVVALATDGTTSVEYWVRCLPPDFPLMEMDEHPSAGAPVPGYYLVSNQPA